VDRSSGTTVPSYDLNDNITNVRAADGSETSTAYDAVNRVTQTTGVLGIVRRVSYDGLNRQVSRTNPTCNVWRFELDARDVRTAVFKPEGTRVAFAHDRRQRLTSVGNALSQRKYGYGGFSTAGLLNTAASTGGTANALSDTFQYHSRGQMTRQSQGSGAFGLGLD
jgi:YD repeat-containing protein